MNNDNQKEGTARLTGAWKRKSKFGDFYVGKITREQLTEALAHLGSNVNDFEIVASEVTNKKTENSPDMSFSLRIPFVKDVEAAAPVAQQATGTNGRGYYSKKK